MKTPAVVNLCHGSRRDRAGPPGHDRVSEIFFISPLLSVIMPVMSLREILTNNPLVLAPLAGITDFPFRRICKEMGAGLVFSEMVSVEALIREHKRTAGMLRTEPAERPVAFQIFGSKPASMAEAAAIVSRGEADFIDINMGCPVPKILKSGAGSALLRDLGLAREIME